MNRVWRSWPWTLALAAVLAGFVALGLIGLGLRTSASEVVVSLLVVAAGVGALLRVLSIGVRATPTGLAIRDLTRTTLVEWTRIRSVTCEPAGRRGVYVPVLTMTSAGARTGGSTRLEITVLGSYREQVARRRAEEIAQAHPAKRPTRSRPARRSTGTP